jgi:hypothetical protein
MWSTLPAFAPSSIPKKKIFTQNLAKATFGHNRIKNSGPFFSEIEPVCHDRLGEGYRITNFIHGWFQHLYQ